MTPPSLGVTAVGVVGVGCVVVGVTGVVEAAGVVVSTLQLTTAREVKRTRASNI